MAWWHKFGQGLLQGVATTLPGTLREGRRAKQRRQDVDFREGRAEVSDYNTRVGNTEESARAAYGSGDYEGAAGIISGAGLDPIDLLRLEGEQAAHLQSATTSVEEEALGATEALGIAFRIADTEEQLLAAKSHLGTIRKARAKRAQLGIAETDVTDWDAEFETNLARLRADDDMRQGADALTEIWDRNPEVLMEATEEQVVAALAKKYRMAADSPQISSLARTIRAAGKDDVLDQKLGVAVAIASRGPAGAKKAADMIRRYDSAMADYFLAQSDEYEGDESIDRARQAVGLGDYKGAADIYTQGGYLDLAASALRAGNLENKTLTPERFMRDKVMASLRLEADAVLDGKEVVLEDIWGQVNRTFKPMEQFIRGADDLAPGSLDMGAGGSGGDAVHRVYMSLEKIWEPDWRAEEVIAAFDGGYATTAIGHELSPEDRKAVMDRLRLTHPDAFGSAAEQAGTTPLAQEATNAGVAAAAIPGRSRGRGGVTDAAMNLGTEGVDLSEVADLARAAGQGLLRMNPALAFVNRQNRNKQRQAKVSSRTLKALGEDERKVK